MKKQLIILSSFFIILNYSYSQDKEKYIGIAMGPSIPQADYSSRDMNNAYSGFAKNGLNINISYSIKTKNNSQVVFSILKQSNPFDAGSMSYELSKKYPSIGFTVESDNWEILGFFIGDNYLVPILKGSTFELRGMLGLIEAKSPWVTTTASQPGLVSWVQQNNSTSESFACQLGGGFKLKISEKTFLSANCDYLLSQALFENVIITTSAGVLEKVSFKQNINSINATFGLIFKI